MVDTRAEIEVTVKGLDHALDGFKQLNKEINAVKDKSPVDPIQDVLPKNIARVERGLTTVNNLLGQRLGDQSRLHSFASGFVDIASKVDASTQNLVGFNFGLADMSLKGAASAAVLALGFIAIANYIADCTGAAATFQAALDDVGKSMMATPEQIKAFGEATFGVALTTGVAQSDVLQIVKEVFESNVGQEGIGEAGKVNPELSKYVTQQVIELQRGSIPEADAREIAALLGKQMSLRDPTDDVKTFTLRSTESMANIYTLFHQSVSNQSMIFGVYGEQLSKLQDHLGKQGVKMAPESSTDLAAFAAAASQLVPKAGRNPAQSTLASARAVGEFEKKVMTTEPAKRYDIARVMGGLSDEELAQKQASPLKFMKEIIERYAKAGIEGNTGLQASMRATFGEIGEDASVLDTMAGKQERLFGNLDLYEQKMKDASTVHTRYTESQTHLDSQMEIFWGRINLVGMALGSYLVPILTEIVSGINGLLSYLDPLIIQFSKLAEMPEVQLAIKALAIVLGGVLLAGIVLIGAALAPLIAGFAGFVGGLVVANAAIIGIGIAITSLIAIFLGLFGAVGDIDTVWTRFWDSDIGKKLSVLTGGKINISTVGDLFGSLVQNDTFKTITRCLMIMVPGIGIMVYVIQEIYKTIVYISNILQGLGDWFNNLIESVKNLYTYFTGYLSDSQAQKYQQAHPELATESLDTVKQIYGASHSTLLQDLLNAIPGAPKSKTDSFEQALEKFGKKQPSVPIVVPTAVTPPVIPPTPTGTGYVPPVKSGDVYTDAQLAKDRQNAIAAGILDQPTSTTTEDKSQNNSGWGWLGQAATGVKNALGLAAGTDYIPRDGFAFLHQGEAVTPASQSKGDNNPINLTFNATFNIQGGNEGMDNFRLRKTIEDVVFDAIRHSMSY